MIQRTVSINAKHGLAFPVPKEQSYTPSSLQTVVGHLVLQKERWVWMAGQMKRHTCSMFSFQAV
jgi:hypothetical protein